MFKFELNPQDIGSGVHVKNSGNAGIVEAFDMRYRANRQGVSLNMNVPVH